MLTCGLETCIPLYRLSLTSPKFVKKIKEIKILTICTTLPYVQLSCQLLIALKLQEDIGNEYSYSGISQKFTIKLPQS